MSSPIEIVLQPGQRIIVTTPQGQVDVDAFITGEQTYVLVERHGIPVQIDVLKTGNPNIAEVNMHGEAVVKVRDTVRFDDEGFATGYCPDCGTGVEAVRPGKWQCPKCG